MTYIPTHNVHFSLKRVQTITYLYINQLNRFNELSIVKNLQYITLKIIIILQEIFFN
jgi:hypothetical protein